MKKLLQKSLVALALFGSADAAFAVERRNDATNEQIDTRNNGWPAKEAFSDVAQEVTRLSLLGDERVTNEMRTDLNNAFEAFFREWCRSEFSEDVVSADDFVRLVTHPVLELMSVENRMRIFEDVAIYNGRTDILRHCLGSTAFKNYLGSTAFKNYRTNNYERNIASDLSLLCYEALKACDRAQKNGGEATQRDEERAIAALFLAETEFASVVYECLREGYLGGFFVTLAQTPPIDATSACFLRSQINYITTGQLVLLNQNEEETMWQNANPHQILENLGRIRELGLTIPDSVASRLFTDGNMRDVANILIARYMEERGETVLSGSFLRRLERSGLVNEGLRSSRRVPHGVGFEILRSEGEPFIPDDELRERFMKVRQLSRDVFEALRRQRVEGQGQGQGQGQGHANQ